MQRNDTIDSSKQRRVGGRDQNSGQQDPVQHFVLTSQLQALAGQGRLSLIPGLTNTASPASTSPGTQVTPPVTLSTPLQHQTAVVVTSQDLGRLFTAATVSGTSTTQTCSPVISAQTLQRQFSGQGIVGVLSPGRQQGTAALVARSIPAGTTELQIAQPLTLVTTSASVTTGNLGIVSGGTVHHHGQSPSRGAQPTPRPNLQQTSFKMNTQTNPQQQSPRASVTVAGSTGGNLAAAAAGKVLQETKPAIAPSGLSLTFPNLTALANQSAMGPSPKKKIKIEEKAPATQEIANNRKLILDHKYKEMLEIKENYIEYLTELFFLQNGGNLMDYFAWKKRPTPQLVHFLKSGNLDSDEEEDHGQERKINNEVKVITCSGSNVPLATPVAIATTLPPSVAALNQQATTTGFETRRPGGRHGMVFGHVQPVIAACASSSSVGSGVIPSQVTSSFSISSTSLIQSTVMSSAQTNTVTNQRPSTCVSSSSVTTVTTATTSVSMPQLQSQLAKVITESKPLSVHTGHVTKSTMSPPTSSQSSPALRTPKTPPTSPGGTLRAHTRQGQISAVYDGAIGSQEAIVERAKQEAQVMQRVAELRKEGLWSSRRLPKVQEPPRNKGHWDYLLEEMQWLAADFQQERKWKKAAARKVAKMVSKYFQELEQKEMRAEKEEGQKLKRIAGQIAKQIREFWTNIEKVVQYKHQTRMEEKRKKALDIHLNFIVDQTEKYSTWLTEGLKKGKGGSSVATTPDQSIDGGDDEFEPEEDDADDEETIEKEEEDLDDESTKAELDALQKEGEVPIEELLQSLPKEVLDKPARLDDEEEQDDNDKDGDHDKEFTASEDEEVDVEETIEEQEKEEKKMDYSTELKDLENEGEMDIEELYKKYAGAYDSDFEMPESSGTEDDDDDDESTDDDDEEEDEEDEEEEIVDKDVGLEFLMDTENTSQETKTSSEYEEKGPGKEITDIAAEAQSLQPKGYTLQTTEVKTQVPFLLRGTLREYQHVGLDWLATMYEKRLNGILADEMGLGKTIQTIALLAHLACDKGIWGPHLIVVPTSVMLNWEMEIKKWCPAFKILTYYGNQKERKLKRQGWTKTNAFHVCITSYKLVIQDHQSFRRKKWKYFILDEAQNIKNFKSQRWQTLLNFSSQRRLLLTGTPLQNSLMELWSLMHFLMPNVFQSHREFKEWFANPLTGMIEGSHEYNESLIRRLHKVLRPFLLRRLKADVEKQMPKKYEHVVMCHLSKRQRFLYDEFMSQTKTKETLAAGHFMSVINILMQLRKVCNHPSLFDPRPIISPFQTEGIVYHTASLALDAVKYDPFKNIDIHSLYPSLADMELDLPAFIAHRVKRLQTPRKLIEEIDDQPEPEPRPQPGKLKPVTFRSVSPMIQSGRSTPVITTSDSNVSSSATTTVQSTVSSRQPTTTVASSVSQPISTVSVTTTSSVTTQPVHTTLQAKVVPQGSQSSQQVTTSQPITVQIQHTEQGARLMIPAGQLSQLPAGFIQIVQTSMGQQIIATSNPMTTSTQQRVSSPLGTAVSPAVSVTTSSTTLVNGLPTITTVATMSPTTTVTSVTTQVRTTPTVQLPTTTTAATAQKPVMRVSPLVSESGSTFGVTSPVTKVGQVSTTMSTTSVRMSVGEENKHVTRSVSQRETAKVQKKSELYLDSVCLRRQQQRKEKLEYIARINKLHCERKPVYGQDLCLTVNVLKDMECTRTKDNTWHGIGYVHCYNVHAWKNPHHPDCFWHQTKVLSNLVHTPIQYLNELEDILSRFVFATPPVTSPRIQMHVSHPPPSQLIEDRQRDFLMQTEVSPKASCLHKISTNRIVQFPELRLIQYDCGKLQVLDILLRRLKSEQHRVLIFTQMTKMLDVLEAFLNYHGHRYLRLDGTTRVEQRQMLMDRFNADKRIFCFILSTRSGGIGVNLTGADTVVFYDSDWNPTMDAQAQDRCHRIGQTRDVHIYRLISERTVEENILKKANQKRMLGDMAIEGGNFTTAFFKEQTIKELFSEPSGLDSLVKQKQVEDQNKDIKVKKEVEEVVKKTSEKIKVEKEESPPPVVQKSETNIVAQFEQALEKAEDETDVVAANLVKAEQKAELAEFDEDIPWDEREAERRKEEEEISRAEQELAMLEKELSPVERYAVVFMEQEMDPSDELQMAEEDIESSKKDWELARLKALKEEEERRLEIEEDEMLYTYSRDDAYNQVFISDADQEEMPMWAPPTPPHDDNDIYIDQSMFFLYEPTIMPETQLPPIHVKKEHKKPKIESITTRKQKQRKEEQPRVPRSLFDRPTAVMRMRRDAKLKQGLLKPFRPVQPQLNKPTMDPAPDHPEWLIHEDWALLQAVQSLFDVPLNLMVVSPAHIPNWDLVADVVSSISRVYRSAKQCKNRYENVIIPREEGRILYDINPRKQSKKTKGIYKTKNNRPMRTSQLYVQDSNNAVTMLHSLRFESVKSLAGKRPPTLKQTLVNPTPKHSKHAAVLSESGIIYDNPRNPMQVAEIRAQRIQREKKQNQAAAQATAEQQLAAQRTQAQQSAQQTVTPSTPQSQPQPTTVTATIAVPQGVAQVQQAVAQQLQPIATTVTQAVVTGVALPAKTAVGQTAVSLARTVGAVGTGNIVVNTPGAVGTPSFAAINRRISQATAQPVTVGAITPAIRTQRGVPGGQLTIQEITAITSQAGQQVAHVATGQVARSQIQTTVPSSITTQLARIASTQATTISAAGVPAKTYTQQQLIALQQRQLVTSTNRALLQQQQPRKLTPEQLRQQQQLKQLQARSAVPGQKQTVITASQHLVTSLGQVPKQGQVKTTTAIGRQVPQELLLQQQKLSQKAQVQVVQQPVTAQLQQMPTTQIIQAQVHQVGQPAVTTAVKTVSAAPTGIQIPVSQLQQQKAGVAKATINPLQPQLKQMQLIGQRKQALQQPQKITSLAHPITKPLAGNTVQIIQQPLGAGQNLTYQLQQIVKRNPSSMIITSQPTIIATVTQSQQPGQQYKVLSTSNTQSSQLQTITAVSTPQPVTHATGATSQPSVATLSMAVATPQTQVSKPTVVSAVGAADPTGQTVQVHSVSSQQPKIATISHVVTTQPLQQIQVTPATLQQVHTTNVVQPSSSTAPSTVTVTVAPSTQSPLTATLIQQTAHSSPQTQQVPATQGTQQQVQNSPQTTAITQTVVPMAGTVTSQAALAAASALPQGVAQQPQVITGVVQQVTQATAQQVVQAQSSKAAPYAMRTRNPPKH